VLRFLLSVKLAQRQLHGAWQILKGAIAAVQKPSIQCNLQRFLAVRQQMASVLDNFYCYLQV
jgi:hypothetical protein